MILHEKYELERKLFRDFAEREFTPELIDRLEQTSEFDEEIFKKMADAGFMGAKIPREYGGQGGDSLTHVLMNEEFARVSPVLCLYSNTPNSLGSGPLLSCATEEQKLKYLPPLARGEKTICFALTEPCAGSDAGGVSTTAVKTEGGFILNGRKCFTSGAPIADYALVFARSDPNSKGAKGISLFIMDMHQLGVTCGRHEDKMGIRGYPTSDVIMKDVFVPDNALLGPLDYGYITAMNTLNGGRLGIAAQALGIAQGCLDEAVSYAKTRKQFGKTISKLQGISFMIADMATEIEAARELVYSTAMMKDANSPETGKRCAMAKYYAAEVCNRVAYKAVQIFGGYGFIKEYKVERFYRDARITSIYEGTSQVQQVVIANSLLRD